MIVLAFDLSSTCIGVTFAKLTPDETIETLTTQPVIPKEPDGKTFGYTTKQPKTLRRRGTTFQSFLKPGESSISQAEGKRRASWFRHRKHNYLLRNIGKQLGMIIERLQPGVLIIERNASFNGVLTTKLLAEIAGGLYFIAGARGVPLYDYPESTVRAHLRREVKQPRITTEAMSIETKWLIYQRLRQVYDTGEHPHLNFDTMTLDESDALATFHYWYDVERRQGGETAYE